MDSNSSFHIADGEVPTVLSIVIVSYKCRDLLSACLKSIRNELRPDQEVIISDNGSDDGTEEMVLRDFPFARFIGNNANLGFAKANNIACAQSSGKYVLLLNPDTELTGETLGRLVSYMEKNRDVSAAGCKVLYPDGTFQFSSGHLPSPATAVFGGVAVNRLYRKLFPNRNFLGASGILPEASEKETHEVETLLGACVILRRSILDDIGFFDENMFMYFEECDLFLRIIRSGGRIMYITDTHVIHHAGGTTKSISTCVGYYQKSLEYYLSKNFHLRKMVLFRLSLLVSSFLKAMVLFLCLIFRGRDRGRLKGKIAWHWHTFRFVASRLLSTDTPSVSGESNPMSVSRT